MAALAAEVPGRAIHDFFRTLPGLQNLCRVRVSPMTNRVRLIGRKVVHVIRLTGMPGFRGSLTDTQSWQVSILLANADKVAGFRQGSASEFFPDRCAARKETEVHSERNFTFL